MAVLALKFFNNTTHEIGNSTCTNNNSLNTDSVRYEMLLHKLFLVDITLRSFCSSSMTNLLCEQFRELNASKPNANCNL